MSGFKFKVTGATTSNNSAKSNVDFDAMNKYVVETVDCEQPETLNGIIAGIVDLGNQPQPDAQYDVDEEDVGLSVEELNDKYSSEIESGKLSEFKEVWNHTKKVHEIKKCVPQPNRQSIVMAVDFPDILVDKGQFFGESNPLPLRLWTGGQFFDTYKNKMIVQNMMAMRFKKESINGKDEWTMPFTSLPYKMAVASKVIKQGQAFLPEQIAELIGKTLQWQVQIFMKEGTNGKSYYTERLKYVGGIQKKDTPFESDELFLVQVSEPTDPESLKQVRKHVWNTIENATNWEGSPLQKQKQEYDEGRFNSDSEVGDEGEKEVETKTTPKANTKKSNTVESTANTPSQEQEFDDGWD